MPSSISSSSRPARGPWALTWLVALAVAVCVLGGWEWHLRGKGVRPGVNDESAAWSVARAGVEPSSMVVLGASRIQSAVVPEVFAEHLDGRVPVQLSLVDTSPLPLLEDLAADGSFQGVVLVEVIETMLFDASGAEEQHAYDMLRADREVQKSPARWSEARLGLRVQERLVFRRPAFSLRQVLQGWFGGRRLDPPYVWERLDRFRSLDFRRIDGARRMAKLVQVARERGRPATGVELEQLLGRLRTATAAIQARGGQVVFLRLPSTGRLNLAEERRYPRARYWDRLVDQGSGRAVHFEDAPELQGYRCPDGSHLDYRDARRFSAALAGVLRPLLTP